MILIKKGLSYFYHGIACLTAHCFRLGQHGIVDLKKKNIHLFDGTVLGDVSVDFDDQSVVFRVTSPPPLWNLRFNKGGGLVTRMTDLSKIVTSPNKGG